MITLLPKRRSDWHTRCLWVRSPALEALTRTDPALEKPLHPALPYTGAEVRFEMARTVEDVLARRTRALFLNAKAALAMAPCVAEWMAAELNCDAAWKAQQVRTFEETARHYMLA